MMHADMKHYTNGKKKKYDAWSTRKKEQPEFVEFKPKYDSRRSNIQTRSIRTAGTMHDTCVQAKKEYTGTLVKGISTMHKSNAVPIINEQELVDHANMRR